MDKGSWATRQIDVMEAACLFPAPVGASGSVKQRRSGGSCSQLLAGMSDGFEEYHGDGVIDLICKLRVSCSLLIFCSQSHICQI